MTLDYGSWGGIDGSAPVYDNDTPTDTMPTGTIRRVKKSRGFNIPLPKILLIVGGGVAGIILLSALLGGNDTPSFDEDVMAETVGGTEEVQQWQQPIGLHNLPADLSTLSTDEVERLLHESRQDMRAAHQRYLDAIDSVGARLTDNRAREWENHASRECQEMNEQSKVGTVCINTPDKLFSLLGEKERDLSRLAPNGTMPLDRESIRDFQIQAQRIREISGALYGRTGDRIATSESFLPIMQAREGVNLARTKHEALRLDLQTRLTQGLGQEMEGSHFDEP